MTAIVGILNKRGVAIAADSASTLRNKIINSGNKMLRLSNKTPIAVMVVNNSSLAGMPWEVIIRWYRKELGDNQYDLLVDYITDFLTFVQNKVLDRDDVPKEKARFGQDAISYLVFAGYGIKEQLPSILECEVYGINRREILCQFVNGYEVSTPDKDVVIYSEGQPDIIKAYIDGVINTRTNSIIDGHIEILKNCIYELSPTLISSLSEDDIREKMKMTIEKCKKESVDAWLSTIRDYSLQEMASLAENLIKATELHRKMMAEVEQVGGLIDLAIITKNDGFQWLNRKSWYEPSRGGQYGKFGI